MVEVRIVSEEDVRYPGKTVAIIVKDHGRGIQDADKQKLFELNMRGDGLIETGNGLGLYCARKAARLQGGNVTLESSLPNQGSIFKLILPFAKHGTVVQGMAEETSRQTHTALRWGLAMCGILATAALLTILFKPPQTVAFVTHHDDYGDRYITAQGADEGWLLTQNEELSECGKFKLIPRGDKVALLTCYGRYVTAPWRPNLLPVTSQHDKQWLLWQDSSLGDCALYDLINLRDDSERPGNKVTLRTCAGMYLTPGDGGWPDDLQWAVVAETDEINEWEEFILEQMR